MQARPAPHGDQIQERLTTRRIHNNQSERRGVEADACAELLPPDDLPAGEAAQGGGPETVRGAAGGEAVPHRGGGVHEAE
eukprot:8799261-Pyramimonas_sp.AAC.1